MSDNYQIPGTDGVVVAADDIGGVKIPLVKMAIGDSGTEISAANPWPVLIHGTDDAGSPLPVPTTAEGHIEVAIHGPRLPFGAVDVASLRPIVQGDAIYGINTIEVLPTTTISGTATAADNMFQVSSGAGTAGSSGTIQSRKRLRYRAGQGIVGRYTALFTTGVENNVQVAGLGTAESTFGFGYNGASFGILHSTGGVREIQTLTITTASTATNSYVVTLPNGSTVNVAATNNGNTARTAYEIAQGTFPGWSAESRGSTVVFLANGAGNQSGTFSLAQTGAGVPAAGTCVETLAGVAATDTWVPQSSWNGDKLDGTGSSGVTLDTTKGNIFQIEVQYLGFGSVVFKVEVVASSGNNADLVTVHTLKFPNTRTTPHTSQPSFPFLMSSYNTGTASGATTVKCGSFAGFVAGEKVLTGPRMSYFTTTGVTSSTSAYTPIFTVRNDRVYASRANQAIVNLLSVTGASKSTTGITTFLLIRNATLTGNPNFQAFSPNSCTYWDTASTGCSFTNNEQVIWTSAVSEAGQFTSMFADDITLQPGESVTLAVRSVTATAVCVGGINTREDD